MSEAPAVQSLVASGSYLVPGVGSLGGPTLQHNYKRALVQAAPRDFAVQVLPPTKFGNVHCFGMHIIPYMPERPDNNSSSSRGSHHEYEIWRRWEDCLWFQENLEMEYSVMAREKRTRLARGKGVKKNGIYMRSDQAASFESLPPGPEAQSIAKDIHEIIPKLTKKATIFRASQATIDQRAREFKDMITALFAYDVPTLIKELRDQRVIRDFFGTWRRDIDLSRKNNVQDTQRASVSSSVFSTYFASNNLSVQLPTSFPEYPSHPPLPSFAPRSPSSISKPPYSASGSGSDHTTSSSSLASTFPNQPPLSAPAAISSSFRLPEPEDDSKSSRAAPRSFRWSTGSSKSSDSNQSLPLFFADPQRLDQSGLQALPEDQEFNASMASMSVNTTNDVRPVAGRRPRINSCPDRGNRNGLIFNTPPQQSDILDSDIISALDITDPDIVSTSTPPRTAASSQFESSLQSRPPSMAFSTFSDFSQQPSWRTSVLSESSISPREYCPDLNYMQTGLDSPQDLSLVPEDIHAHSPTRDRFDARASISTIGSLISDYSLDSVYRQQLYHNRSQSSLRRSSSVGSRRPVSALSSASAGGLWYEQEDLIDTYFYDPTLRVSSIPVDDQPQSPGRESLAKDFGVRLAAPERFPKPFQHRPPGQFHLPWTPEISPPLNPTTLPDPALTSPSSSVSGTDVFTVKVILEDAIVLLRVPVDISLAEMRGRIAEKYAVQEGLQLSSSFVIGCVTAPSERAMSLPKGRPRSNSASSTSALQSVRRLTTEPEWRSAIDNGVGKLSIRLLNAH